MPNVPTDVLNFKEEYDHKETGWGRGGSRASYWNSYFLNNNNTVGIPAYGGESNLHKSFEFKNKWVRFVNSTREQPHIADKKYAASGNARRQHAGPANKTLFFAAMGGAFYAGVTLGLF